MSSASVAEQPVHGNEADNTGKADLVLQGGGVKGIGLLGAVNKLREVAGELRKIRIMPLT